MNALAPYIAALHQQDLLDEAELRRCIKLVRGSGPTIPAWRRALGSGARALSGLFALAARALDPTIEAERPSLPQADAHRARAIATS